MFATLQSTCWPVAKLRHLLDLTPRRPSGAAPPIGHQMSATGPRAVIPGCFLLGRVIETRSKERERRVNEQDGSKTAKSWTHGRNISIILHCSPHKDVNSVKFFHSG
jgi:hypothetical protein